MMGFSRLPPLAAPPVDAGLADGPRRGQAPSPNAPAAATAPPVDGGLEAVGKEGSTTVGARLVHQAGANQGGGLGTNLYFSFSQQVRAGTDVFLLFSAPNSPKTRGKFTLKLVRPL